MDRGVFPVQFCETPAAPSPPATALPSSLEHRLEEECATYSSLREEAIHSGDFDKATAIGRFLDDVFAKYSVLRQRISKEPVSTVPLELVQVIPIEHELWKGQGDSNGVVSGRLDHFSYDAEQQLIFLACLGDNSVVTIDAFAGTCEYDKIGNKTLYDAGIARDHGLAEPPCGPKLNRPQGVLWVAQTSRLYVANAGNGIVNIFERGRHPRSVDQRALHWIGCVDFEEEADNLRYHDRQVFVGYGEGAIGVIEDKEGAVWRDDPNWIPIDASAWRRDPELDLDCDGEHPESFQLEQGGHGGQTRLLVNVADKQLIHVFDRRTGESLAQWPLPEGLSGNFPMCLVEVSKRLLVGVRGSKTAGKLLVIHTDTGAVLQVLDCVGDMDDLCYDPGRGRVYVVGGAGAVSFFQESPTGAYTNVGEVQTAVGARTGFWCSGRGALYVAAPGDGQRPPRLLAFHAT